MSTKKKTKILDPQTWYDLINKEYKKYHNFLDKWEKSIFLQYLPRNLKNLSIIDLWAWDGRMIKYFKNQEIKRYLACDISSQMLKNCNNRAEKKIIDFEEKIDIDEESFDLAICFFTLLHIKNIENFFKQIKNILKEQWQFIIFHHIERRQFAYNLSKNKIKIISYPHSYKKIQHLAENLNFYTETKEIYEKDILIGKLFNLIKQ